MPIPDLHLRLLRGGRSLRPFGPLQVALGPEERPPFLPSAQVVEEDTWLVMSAGLPDGRGEEHVVRILTAALDADPLLPGQVLLRKGSPPRLLAIVRDFDQEPSCRREWIEVALRNVLRAADSHRLDSLALPLLGTEGGPLHPGEFVVLLRRLLVAAPPVHLRRLWLVVPVGEGRDLLPLLQAGERP